MPAILGGAPVQEIIRSVHAAVTLQAKTRTDLHEKADRTALKKPRIAYLRRLAASRQAGYGCSRQPAPLIH
jgi:hypothetical protein